MIFCTPWFLLFSLVTAVAYLVVRQWQSARLVLMLASSIVFYLHFAGLPGFLAISLLAAFTYFAGFWIHSIRARAGRTPGALLALCLAPAVLALLYFRYFGFLRDSLALGFGWLHLSLPISLLHGLQLAAPVIHPLGISFFAFEFCHYLIDVSKGAGPVRNPIHFSLFALFYPRLASGPIVRFQQIVPQLVGVRRVTHEDAAQGLLRISIGFAKKFLLADPAAQLTATAFQAGNILTGGDVLWLCLLLYIRIYMDFGGYCDMAVGLARLWGIKLPENFHFPFLATSPSTFWRRWHITLSTWIRDYIYIPLGGGHVPAWRKAINLLFAMALCGLWHGSAWNFVLWGVLHGVALQFSHGLGAICDWTARIGPTNRWVRRIGSFVVILAGWALTQSFVSLAWIFFFFSAEDAWKILAKLRMLL